MSLTSPTRDHLRDALDKVFELESLSAQTIVVVETVRLTFEPFQGSNPPLSAIRPVRRTINEPQVERERSRKRPSDVSAENAELAELRLQMPVPALDDVLGFFTRDLPPDLLLGEVADAVRRLRRIRHPLAVQATSVEVADMRKAVADSLQVFLDKLLGGEPRTFGSFEANRAFAHELRELLQLIGARVRCPKEGCGKPSTLRVIAGTCPTGVFVFKHGSKTTHGGWAKTPRLSILIAGR